MTTNDRRQLLRQYFDTATRRFGNPGDKGTSPREYARFIASQIRKMTSVQPPTMVTVADAIAFADELDRGEFDPDLAALMGYQ